MAKNENYTQKKVLYNPTIGFMILILVAVGFIYLILKSEAVRNFLIQFVEGFNRFMSKSW